MRADNLERLEVQDHATHMEASHFTISSGLRALNTCTQVRIRDSGLVSNQQPSSVTRSIFDGYGSLDGSCSAGVRLESAAARAAGSSRFEARVVNGTGDGVLVAALSGVAAWQRGS